MDSIDDSSTRFVKSHFNIAKFGNEMDAFDDYLNHLAPVKAPNHNNNVAKFLANAADVVNDDDSYCTDSSDEDSLADETKYRTRPGVQRKHSGDLEKLFNAPPAASCKPGVYSQSLETRSSPTSQTRQALSTKKDESSKVNKSPIGESGTSSTKESVVSRRRRDEIALSEHGRNRRTSSKNDELSRSDHRGSSRRNDDLSSTSMHGRRSSRKDQPEDLEPGSKLSRVSRTRSGVALSSAAMVDDLSASRHGRRASRKEESGSRVSGSISRSASGVALSTAARRDELSASRHGRRALRKEKVVEEMASKAMPRSESGTSLSSAGKRDELSSSRHGRRGSRNTGNNDQESRGAGRSRSVSRPGPRPQRPSNNSPEDDAGASRLRRASRNSEVDLSSHGMRRVRSTADAGMLPRDPRRAERLGTRERPSGNLLGSSSNHMRRSVSTADARMAGVSGASSKKGVLKRDIDDILLGRGLGSKTKTFASPVGKNAKWNLTGMTADAQPTKLNLVF